MVRVCATYALFTSLSLALLTAPACAQGAANPSPSPFNGLYAGAGIGMTSMTVSERGADATDTGFTYDALLGWRQDFTDGLVWAVEGHVQANQARDKGVLLRIPGTTSLYRGETSLGRNWGFDGVIGHTFGRQQELLIFGSVGYANQRLENCCVLTDENRIRTVTSNEEGYRLGLGGEMALMPHFSWRAVFYYTDTGPVDQEAIETALVVGF